VDPNKARIVGIVGPALAGGLVIASLSWRADVGLSWFLLVVASALVIVRALDRGRPTGLALAWAAAAVWLAGCVVWRASAWTVPIAFPASLVMVTTLPLVVHRRMTWSELGDLPALSLAWLVGGGQAAGDARRALKPVDGRANRRVLGGLVLGLPIACVAAGLLSANPQFRSASNSLLDNGSDVVSFVWWTACVAAAVLLGVLALDRLHARTFAVVRDPALLGHVTHTRTQDTRDGESPYRASETKDAVVERVPRSLAALTWAMVLGQLTLVFGLFVVANFASFFGGHDLVRSAGTSTYSQYLHAGFAEVTAATLFGVTVVMFGHRVVAAPKTRGQRQLLAALEITLLALTAVTLGSCWQRMSIYMDAYGTTHLRLFTMVWQVFALGLLVLTLVRSVVRNWRYHTAALVLWPVVVAIGAASLNADLLVARVNLQRLVDAPETATSTGLDGEYLETLSLDALPALDDPHVPPELAERLHAHWLAHASRQSPDDPRGWRGLANAL
jgi:hypothetical protein